MATLNRLDILGSDDLHLEKISVPQWGGDLFVRILTAAERDAFEASVSGGKRRNLVNLRARLVVLTACDEKGERLFQDADIEALGKKSAAAMDRVFGVSAALNGFTSGDIESLEGESAAGL
jgi:hypothetical protein